MTLEKTCTECGASLAPYGNVGVCESGSDECAICEDCICSRCADMGTTYCAAHCSHSGCDDE